MKKIFDVQVVRKDFPALSQKVRGKDLVYLDSAATTLKPKTVIDRITQYYSFETANVHRGAHYLSDLGTINYEAAREAVRAFLNAPSADSVIFTSGTTEALNLVAASYGRTFLKKGDRILITAMEHHANIVPWQILRDEKDLYLDVVQLSENGELDPLDLQKKLALAPKIFSFTACSNTLGTVNPVQELVKMAHEAGAVAVVDAAQSVLQDQIDVQKWNADFVCFSAHKLFAPTGFGILYGKSNLLNQMPPYKTGGAMITSVQFDKSEFQKAPMRFEAGTPHIEGAIGLHAAINYLSQFNWDEIHQFKARLRLKVEEELLQIKGLRIFGNSQQKASVFSFVIDGLHSSDIGQILDQQGVAVRVGHHCTQPLMKLLKVEGTVRASFSIYNNDDDIQKLVVGLKKAQELLT